MTRNCPDCDGEGSVEEEDMAMDTAVFGAPMGIFTNKKTCSRCGGSGEID